MVRTVIADEKHLSSLLHSSVNDSFVPGLILGQCSQDRDYVVHFAPTPLPKTEVTSDDQHSGDSVFANRRIIKKITEIEEKWFTSHVRNIIRMLPGGMWVLGLYFIGPGDVFSDNSALNKIRSVITLVHRCCKSNEYLFGCNPNNCLYVFNLCSNSKKYSCKSFEVENLSSSLKPINWKFSAEPIKWFQADCLYNMSTLTPYYITEVNKNYPFKKKMSEILVLLVENVQKAVCSVNGRFVDGDESLEDIKAKYKELKLQSCGNKENKKSVEDNFDVFKVNLYVLQEPKNDDDKSKAEIVRSFGNMEYNGRLSSRVFMHSKATAGETTKAIKEDIVRSWASRLEMHWDSYDEKQNKGKSGKTYHLLPRRVLCPLPERNVSLSEYVFPDEEVADVISSFEEQLGISVNLNSVNGTFERPYNPNNPEESNQESQSDGGPQQRTDRRTNSLILVAGVIAATVVLLLSIIIQFTSSS